MRILTRETSSETKITNQNVAFPLVAHKICYYKLIQNLQHFLGLYISHEMTFITKISLWASYGDINIYFLSIVLASNETKITCVVILKSNVPIHSLNAMQATKKKNKKSEKRKTNCQILKYSVISTISLSEPLGAIHR